MPGRLADRVFVLGVVLILVGFALSPAARTPAPAGDDDASPTGEHQRAQDGQEGTRFYHERNQTSFDAMSPVGSRPNLVRDIASGDIDNDGLIDLATGDTGGFFARWRNPGSPFSSPWTSATSSAARNVELGDLDIDGDLDLVTHNASAVFLFSNPGPGADPWTTPWPFSIAGTFPSPEITDLRLGDLDSDGDLDLAVITQNNITVWQNPKKPGGNPWAMFGWSYNIVDNNGQAGIEVADFDLDGRTDLVTFDDGGGNIEIWENDGTPFVGTWSGTQICPMPATGSDIAVGDLDNDGDADIVGSGATSTSLQLCQNPYELGDPFANPWSGATVPAPFLRSIELSDFDNDGWLDIAVTATLDQMLILENAQTPWVGISWQTIVVASVFSAQFDSVLASDLDNDGDADIVATDTAVTPMQYYTYAWNNTLVHRNMPFNASMSFSTPVNSINDVDVGDMDNDGDMDVLSGHSLSMPGLGTLYIWQNNVPWDPSAWSPVNGLDIGLGSPGTSDVGVADLDNDGDLDVISITSSLPNMTLFVWENPLELTDPFTVPWSGGTGVIVGPLTSSNSPAYFDAGDFDCDGDVDIATHFFNLTSGMLEVRVWRNPLSEGGSPFSPNWNSNTIGLIPPPGPMVVDASSIDIGDLDNDGDLDIATADRMTEIRIWENLNSSGVSPWAGFWSGGLGAIIWDSINMEFPKIALSDLDDDGDLDVAFAWATFVQALTNPNDPFAPLNEPFTVIPWTVTTIGNLGMNSMLSIAAGDLDNDGDADVVTGDDGPDPWNNVTVWTNPSTEGGDPWTGSWLFVSYSITLGIAGGNINALALGDLDRRLDNQDNEAGDLDIVHAIQGTPHPWAMENIGAQVGETVFPTWEPTMIPDTYDIIEGTSQSLMRIKVTHNGVYWDNDAELSIWRFMIFDGGMPLTSNEIDALIFDYLIYRDMNGNGVWDVPDNQVDLLSKVVTLGEVSLTFAESTADIDAAIPADTTESYFLVVQLNSTASTAIPNTFNATFDPDGYRIGNWNEVEHEDEDSVVTVETADMTVAGRFRAVAGTLPDLIPGNTPIPTAINVDANPVTGATGTPPVSDVINVPTGSPHTIDSVATNIGPLGTGVPFNVTFFNCTSSGIQLDPPFLKNLVGPLASGASSLPLSAPWDAPLVPNTDYYVCIYVDSDMEVAELNDINNIYVIHFYTIGGGDNAPPRVLNVNIDGAPTQSYSVCALPATINLTALVNDELTGNSDIGGANYTTAPLAWPGTAMGFTLPPTSPSEEMFVLVSTPTAVGSYSYYVYGWDIVPNYNNTGPSATLTIVDDCAPEIDYIALNGQPSLTATAGTIVAVTSMLNDTNTGNSNIANANYTVDGAWPGTDMDATDGAYDSPVEDVTSITTPIDTTGWSNGPHTICVYGNDTFGNENLTGLCATLTIAPELIPPEIINVFIDGAAIQSYSICSLPATINLTAFVNDTLTGNSDIGGANYTTSPLAWPGTAMAFTFPPTSPGEEVYVIITTPSALGTYNFYVYAWDVWNNANNTGPFATLTIVDDCAPEIDYIALNGQPSLTVTAGTIVTVTSMLNDTNTGNSNIANANYTVDGAWPGTDLDATDGAYDSPVEDVTSITTPIDTTGWTLGPHPVCVYGNDTFGNENLTGLCTTLTIVPELVPPEIVNVFIDGAATQSYSICSLPATINLTAFVNDTLTGNSDIGGANYTTSPLAWPGTVMAFTFPPTSPGEEVYVIIPTPSALGTYNFYVYAWDVWNNANNTGPFATLTIVDDCAPEVDYIALNGLPTPTVAAGTIVTVTSRLNDTNTGNSDIAGANFTVDGAWPGTNMNAVDGTYDGPVEEVTSASGVINTTGWSAGAYMICVYGNDSAGNKNLTGRCATLTVTVTVDGPPTVGNVDAQPSPQTVGKSVTISADVSDDLTSFENLTVRVQIKRPDGSTLGNFTMDCDSAGNCNYTSTFDINGTYTFVIWVTDGSGNVASAPGSFAMQPAEQQEKESVEFNWKPVIALVFAIVLLLLGTVVARKKPLEFKNEAKRMLYTWLALVLPFSVVEALTGVISAVTGLLSVPPLMGAGMLVDLGILFAGIIVFVLLLLRKKEEMVSEPVAEKKAAETGAAATDAEPSARPGEPQQPVQEPERAGPETRGEGAPPASPPANP